MAVLMSDLRRHAFPMMGDLPVSDITPSNALAFAEQLWETKPTTANRCLRSIAKVLARAKVQGHRADTLAAAEVTAALPANGHVTVNQPAMAHSEVTAALAKIRQTEALDTSLAIELQVLTATRPSEAQGARWADIDLEGKVWTLQAADKKERRSLRIPLSNRAISILRVAKDLRCRLGRIT